MIVCKHTQQHTLYTPTFMVPTWHDRHTLTMYLLPSFHTSTTDGLDGAEKGILPKQTPLVSQSSSISYQISLRLFLSPSSSLRGASLSWLRRQRTELEDDATFFAAKII